MTGKVLEKLWGFDLNLMKIKAAACSPLPAPIGAAVKTAALSLLLWFFQTQACYLPISIHPASVLPSQSPVVVGVLFWRTSLAKVPGFGRSLQESHGNENP